MVCLSVYNTIEYAKRQITKDLLECVCYISVLSLKDLLLQYVIIDNALAPFELFFRAFLVLGSFTDQFRGVLCIQKRRHPFLDVSWRLYCRRILMLIRIDKYARRLVHARLIVLSATLIDFVEFIPE